MKDAPHLSGLTACKPAESWPCQRQAPLRPDQACAGSLGAAGFSPTGGRAGRFGAAVRAGLSIFHATWVALSAVEQLA
jgi:hypothetical protein